MEGYWPQYQSTMDVPPRVEHPHSPAIPSPRSCAYARARQESRHLRVRLSPLQGPKTWGGRTMKPYDPVGRCWRMCASLAALAMTIAGCGMRVPHDEIVASSTVRIEGAEAPAGADSTESAFGTATDAGAAGGPSVAGPAGGAQASVAHTTLAGGPVAAAG